MLSALADASSAKKKTRQSTLDNFARVRRPVKSNIFKHTSTTPPSTTTGTTRNTDSSSEIKQPSTSPPSMTNGTTNTDNSSEINDDTNKLEGSQGRRGRTLDSDNDLSSLATPLSAEKDNRMWASRNVSGSTTLVDGKSDLSGQSLRESVQADKEDRELGTIHGEFLQLSPTKPVEVSETAASTTQVRKSTRHSILSKTSTVVDKTTKVLGKRVRETVENGKEQVSALYGPRSARLRSEMAAQAKPAEGPVAKKTRLSKPVPKESSPEPIIPKKTTQKRKKTWLEHGLYVGQDRDFDPRLTEARNIQKIAHKASAQKQPFIPLPMYAGQKAMDRGRDFRLPFSVFSPLPPGQPKPDEWRRVTKSKLSANPRPYL